MFSHERVRVQRLGLLAFLSIELTVTPPYLRLNQRPPVSHVPAHRCCRHWSRFCLPPAGTSCVHASLVLGADSDTLPATRLPYQITCIPWAFLYMPFVDPPNHYIFTPHPTLNITLLWPTADSQVSSLNSEFLFASAHQSTAVPPHTIQC